MKNYGDYIGVLVVRWHNERRDDKMIRLMKDNLAIPVIPVGGAPVRPVNGGSVKPVKPVDGGPVNGEPMNSGPVVHRHRCIPTHTHPPTHTHTHPPTLKVSEAIFTPAHLCKEKITLRRKL